MQDEELSLLIEKFVSGHITEKELELLDKYRAEDKELDEDIKLEIALSNSLRGPIDHPLRDKLLQEANSSDFRKKYLFIGIAIVAIISLLLIAAQYLWIPKDLNQNKFNYAMIHTEIIDNRSEAYQQRSGSLQSKTLNDSIGDLLTLIKTKNIDDANLLSAELLASHPNNAMLLLLKGNEFFQNNRIKEAREIWNSLINSPFEPINDAASLYLILSDELLNEEEKNKRIEELKSSRGFTYR